MSIFSQIPSENPKAFKNKSIQVDIIGDKTSDFDEAKTKLKCFHFIGILKQFIQKIVDTTLDNYKLTHRVPIQFLSEEDDLGYVNIRLLADENNVVFKVINKSGEIISTNEYGYLEYRKSPTNGWIATRNGKPKMKTSNKCFTLISEEDWNKLVYDGLVDADMIYVMIDDDLTMY